MRELPVHWYEGMFLRPQHFQAADRYWAEALNRSDQWNHPYAYGLHAIELDKEAIANSQLQVDSCEARLKDGTFVSLGPGQALDRVDLKDAFERESSLRVFLAVPKLQMGRANVANSSNGDYSRYVETRREIQDESRGGNEQEVEFRTLNVRLLLSTQDLSGYEVLPIAQIERAGEREATPRLDVKYIPPVLACDAWAVLANDIVRAIYDLIGQKIDVLSQQVINRGITLSSHEPGDLERILMLSLLNESSAALKVLSFATGIHPLVVYTELCRIVGQLSIFGESRKPPEIPRYDHDDLGGIFYYIKRQIEILINAVRDYEYEQRFFVGVGLGMHVTLDPKWLNADWQWYVGVNKGEMSEKDCRTLLEPGQMDWKLGSARQVEILFKTRAQGLDLVPLERAPRALPERKEWIYYQVTRGNAAWKDVQETQTLAMRLKDSLIENRDRLQGHREIIVSWRGRHLALQFALFAVPTHRK